MNDCGFRIADFGLRARSLFRNPQSAIRNEKGFTLLEVMLAVVILAFVIVSLQGLQNRSVQDVALAGHMTTATLLADRIMSEMLLAKKAKPLVPLEEEGAFDGEYLNEVLNEEYKDSFKDFTWKKIVAPTPYPTVLEVRVAVLWKEGGRDEQVELVSYE